MANKITWLEFQSADLAGSQDFFGKIFGWTFQPMDEGYVMFDTGGGEGSVGGGFGTQGIAQPAVAYISVESIEETLAQVEASGGKVVLPKMGLPSGYGFIGQFQDPNGHFWGLWANS